MENESNNEVQRKLELPINLEETVARLQEFVSFALDCEKRELAPGVSFVEVMKQLQELQVTVRLLNEYQKETLKNLTLLAERQGIVLPKEGEIEDAAEKKVRDSLKSLTQVCEAARERIHAQMIQNPEVQKEVSATIKEGAASEAKKKLRRKNKFRSLGQDGWMQM